MQEVKYLIVLGIIMYGLCQYNKTDLAWIFLIFPIIYTMIQNGLLYGNKVYVDVQKGNNRAFITVEDDGPCIPEDHAGPRA